MSKVVTVDFATPEDFEAWRADLLVYGCAATYWHFGDDFFRHVPPPYIRPDKSPA